MFEDVFKIGSYDSLLGKSVDESAFSSQSSFIDYGLIEGNELSYLKTFRIRFRSDFGNEFLLFDVSSILFLEGILQ